MKLHDLDPLKLQDKAQRILESRLGQKLQLNRMSVSETQYMLNRIRHLIAEHRSTPAFHHSERDPAYLQLIVMEQGLTAQLLEQQDGVFMMPVDTKDPKVQQTLKKAQGGQTLTPDETKMVTAIATQKKESARKPRKLVKESEIQQAQVVLAAQDMVDRIQKMMEDISEMQYKDLPALADSVKNDMGTDQAAQFQSATAAALTQLLSAVQEGKTQMESAQAVLTGQAPVVPGVDVASAAPTGDMGVDADSDAEMNMPPRDDEDDEDDSDSPAAALGRERR
jgi:urease gamma subunit